jgi:hypothetical protein
MGRQLVAERIVAAAAAQGVAAIAADDQVGLRGPRDGVVAARTLEAERSRSGLPVGEVPLGRREGPAGRHDDDDLLAAASGIEVHRIGDPVSAELIGVERRGHAGPHYGDVGDEGQGAVAEVSRRGDEQAGHALPLG